MAQKAKKAVMDEVITDWLKEWRQRFEDLQTRCYRETPTTYALHLISQHFSDLTRDDLWDMRKALRVALENETGFNWRVTLLTPDDEVEILKVLRKEQKRLANILRRFATRLDTFTHQGKNQGAKERNKQPLMEHLYANAYRLRRRFLVFHALAQDYRSWDEGWVKAAHLATELITQLVKHLERLQNNPDAKTLAFLHASSKVLEGIADALSGERPNVTALRRLQRLLVIAFSSRLPRQWKRKRATKPKR